MNTQVRYVIVVEVDNVRARAAYAHGLADLDLAMPAIMAIAKEQDDKAIAEATANRAAYNAKMQQYLEERAAYDAAKAAKAEWDAKGVFNRGPVPHVPPRPERNYAYEFMPRPRLIHATETHAYRYNKIREAMVDKLNLATAATKPFSMTEYDVQYMVACEDGSYVKNLQEDLARRF